MGIKKIFLLLIILGGFCLALSAEAATLSGTGITVNVGQIKAINTLTLTEANFGELTSANDLRIKIKAGTNAEWDVADTAATITTTTGNIGVSGTVSYAGSNKVLVLDVTATSTATSTFTIADLSYIGVSATSAVDLLEFSKDGGSNWSDAGASTTITVADGDEDTLTSINVTPSISVSRLTTNYTINFTVPGDGIPPHGVISATGKIEIAFPADTLFGSVGVSATGIDGSFSVATAGTTLTLTRSGGANSLGGAKSIVLTNITNPFSVGSKTLTITTKTSVDASLASGISASYSIWPMASDIKAPDSSITSPKDGATILAGKDYTLKGEGSDLPDSGLSLGVAKVEVSLDGGLSWQEATIIKIAGSYFEWEYLWKNPKEGDYTLKVRATDQAGNVEIPGPGIKVKVATEIPEVLPPPPPVEKPITEMTVEELKTKITEVQQKIIELLQQLIKLIQAQITELQAKSL